MLAFSCFAGLLNVLSLYFYSLYIGVGVLCYGMLNLITRVSLFFNGFCIIAFAVCGLQRR